MMWLGGKIFQSSETVSSTVVPGSRMTDSVRPFDFVLRRDRPVPADLLRSRPRRPLQTTSWSADSAGSLLRFGSEGATELSLARRAFGGPARGASGSGARRSVPVDMRRTGGASGAGGAPAGGGPAAARVRSRCSRAASSSGSLTWIVPLGLRGRDASRPPSCQGASGDPWTQGLPRLISISRDARCEPRSKEARFLGDSRPSNSTTSSSRSGRRMPPASARFSGMPGDDASLGIKLLPRRAVWAEVNGLRDATQKLIQ